jgi:hypothetical protein
MACIEHSCGCGFWTANNDPTFGPCPECGGRLTSTFDEPLGDERASEDDYDDEEET